MPSCFQLFRKGEKEPVVLQIVDEEICKRFKVEVHPKQWHHGWYNHIGFFLATGKDFEWIKKDCLNAAAKAKDVEDSMHWGHMYSIAVFLESNFDTNAWYEVKK